MIYKFITQRLFIFKKLNFAQVLTTKQKVEKVLKTNVINNDEANLTEVTHSITNPNNFTKGEL